MDVTVSIALGINFILTAPEIFLKERQRKVINRLLEAGPGGFEGGLANRKYAGMGHVSKATAQRELADLVQKGILRTNPGGGRSTSYDLCWDEFAAGGERSQ